MKLLDKFLVFQLIYDPRESLGTKKIYFFFSKTKFIDMT